MRAIDPAVDNPDELRRLYWGEGLYQREIAEIADCSRALVGKRLIEFDIERRPRGQQTTDMALKQLQDAEWLREQYVERERFTTDIAEELGCTHVYVCNKLREHGIEVHTRGFRGGEDHPLYKGVMNDLYGPNWYRQRKKARERDGYTCQRCGVSDSKAYERYSSRNHVHHIKPRSEFIEDGVLDHERANDLTNLISLCHGCHKKWEGLPVDNREVAA